MTTLTVPVTDVWGVFYDTLLPVTYLPGPGRHLFSGGTAALKEINSTIAKEWYLDVVQFKIPLRKET